MPIHAHRLRTAVTDSEARIAAKCARPVSAPEAGVGAAHAKTTTAAGTIGLRGVPGTWLSAVRAAFTPWVAARHLRQLVVIRNAILLILLLSVLWVAHASPLRVAVGPMTAVIAVLALFNLITWRRLSTPRPVSQQEVVLHVLVDGVALAVLLALAGGTTNPLAGVIVLPPALVAACLPWTRAAIAHERERDLQDEHLMRIGALAAGAAHELARPLSTLAVQLREVQVLAAGEGELRPMLGEMEQQLRHCQHTLGTLLTYGSKVIDTDFEVEGLDAFVRRCIDTLRARRPHARAGLSIEVNGPAPLVRHDLALRQAVLSLLDNAADASAPTTPIEVTLGWDDELLRLTIRDHGSGIAPEHERQIGRLFFTTKRRGEGNGLGLPLAMTAIERLGGSLQLTNAEGGGAVARIVLPRAGLATDPSVRERGAT